MSERSTSFEPSVGLVDLLDRVLGSGVIAAGDVVLSVADVDLVYLNLRALLASVQTIRSTDGAEALERLALAPLSTSPEMKPPPRPGQGGPSDRGGRTSSESTGGSRDWPRETKGRATPPRTAALDGIERFARRLDRGLAGLPRIDTDPERVEQGLARLVLTIVDVLRQLMERQAIHRLEAGSLTDDERDRLGRTFMLLDRRMKELAEQFGLQKEDLGLDLDLDVEDLG